ncbi:MAG TPA: cytochrome c [Blastocatellia bacterium]|nr:cytochrome c [Blastocatellia bacterium]
MKRFFYGGLTAIVAGPLVVMLAGLLIGELGFIPVNADAVPSILEKKVFPLVVRAAVARQSSEQASDAALTDDDLVAGARIYKELCAGCHGQLSGRPSVLGSSFYPPAPQLPGRGTGYNRREIFWVVKHGIRNTSMPAWRNLLSDEDLRQVSAFVGAINTLPVTVETKLREDASVGDKSKD